MLTIQPTSKAKSSFAKSNSREATLTSFDVPASAIKVTFGPVTDRPGYTINTNINFG